MQPITYQNITAKHTMNRVKEPMMPFDWSINPYRGCTHGCSFCYARGTHEFLGLQADDTFRTQIMIKSNAAEALEAQLSKIANKHGGNLHRTAREVGVVTIGTATDAYQPIEGKEQLTRECLKVLAKYRIPTMITTRSPLILRDLDLLKEMHIVSINISVNTLDPDICRHMEPATPLPARRLETVGQLIEHGIPAGIILAPILPYLTDSAEQLAEVLAAAQQQGAQFAYPSILRLAPQVKGWFFQILEQQYPQLVPAYRNLYAKTYARSEYQREIEERLSTVFQTYQLPDYVPTLAPTEEQLSFSF